MTVCPYALALSCKRCPIFKVCPLKGVLGDSKKATKAPPAQEVCEQQDDKK